MSQDITFFETPAPLRLVDLCDAIGAELDNSDCADVVVRGVAPIEAASQGMLSFLSNTKYLEALSTTGASAVICAPKHVEAARGHTAVLVAKDPYRAFAQATALLFPAGMRPLPVFSEAGISPAAFVDPAAIIEKGATIEAGAFVGAGARIGSGALIGPGALIGTGVAVGRNSTIAGGATVIHALIGDRVIVHNGARIGCDGFGFAMGPGGHLKVPQVGRVVIQDDVEIGANTTIDRGANRDTIIGEGTKIDNQVQIGHNVVIGRHCVIVAQVGIAGSAELGDYVVLGGKVAVNGHVKIGMGAQIAGLSGVGDDVPPGVQLGGVPARPIKVWMREVMRLKREAQRAEKRPDKGSQDKEGN